uniref:Uncharacterized protein n=1 Tax=Cacopsylla melanoneura TaxID=428564 RepID=A0A8D8QN93_9HEMI
MDKKLESENNTYSVFILIMIQETIQCVHNYNETGKNTVYSYFIPNEYNETGNNAVCLGGTYYTWNNCGKHSFLKTVSKHRMKYLQKYFLYFTVCYTEIFSHFNPSLTSSRCLTKWPSTNKLI